jgi:hypothetical protein
MKNMVLVLWGIFLMFATSAAYASSESDGHTTESKKKYRRWTLEEDHLLGDAVNRYGTENWKQIASQVPNRTSSQCRERWIEQLDPNVKHGNWTKKEDDFIIAFVEKNGHEWSRCAEQLPNRTDNSIKNRWHVLLRQQKNLEEYGTIRCKRGKKLTKNDAKNIPSRQWKNQGVYPFKGVGKNNPESIPNDQHSENLSTGNVDEKNPSFPGKRTKKYWQENEDELLWNAMKRTQNWNRIAAEVPGRTAKQCRDRWIDQLNPFINHGDWTEEEDQLLIEQRQLWGNKWAKIARNFPNRTDNQIKNRWNTHFLKRKRTNPRINQPSPESWGTVSSFDFFDYSFDTENGDWYASLEQ